MLPGTADFAPFRISTKALPARERVSIWREVVSRNLLRVDVEPLLDLPLEVEATLRASPGLRLMSSCVTSPFRMRRTQEHIADNEDEFGLVLNLDGQAMMWQRDEEVALGPGDAVAVSNLDPATLTHQGGTRRLGLLVPRTALTPLVANVEDTAARLIPHDHEALRLLAAYLQLVHAELPLATPGLRRLAVTHVHDLFALALGATRDGAAIAAERGVRAARLAAIKADIAAHLGRHDLTLTALAARQGVTPRYIQMLFESEGVTFSEFVLTQRLARTHRMLSDPRHAVLTIIAIAFEAGFGDISYFNRAFRRRYGATPSDVRAQAQRKQANIHEPRTMIER
jgi:AraC-like DNA-binding protein